MDRLTEKFKNPGYVTSVKYVKKDIEKDFHMWVTECANKLGELEDVEGELNIDLITLFKALIDGIWVKSPEIKKIKVVLEYDQDEGFVFTNHNESWGYNVPEYKNTWSLKKEELKND